MIRALRPAAFLAALALIALRASAGPGESDSLAARVRHAVLDAGRHALTPAQALDDSSRQRAVLPPRPSPIAGDTSHAAADTVATGADVPWIWRTHAERTHYLHTANYDETMRYCRQLEAGSRWIRMVSYGKSGQGRDLPLLILSRDRAFTPEAARATGKPVVLIQNGIHAGEIEGKDACLALVRDIAVLRTREELLDSCIVLVLPIFSVDAHERSGPYNRINQNGPAEMGWRTTPIGLNLNRDYMKAEAPEMRALLREVYTRWWPDLLIDDHTTDGADYQHDVTYAYALGAAIPAPLERWLRDAFEGRCVPRLAAMGHLPAPYLSFRAGNDPRSGIAWGNMPPRFSTSYPPLQGRAAILVETHMRKPYATRVKATYDLLVAVLEELHARPRELTNAVRDAARETAARTRSSDPAQRAVALTTRLTDHSVPFAYRGTAATWETSPISGRPVPHYSAAPWDTILPLYREVEPALSVQMPAGYLIPQEWSDAIALLELHGLRVRRFASAWRDTVELQHVDEWNASKELVEGHHPLQITRVSLVRAARTYRPGDAWVPIDQPGALLAVNLLEAQASDGLAYWNFFDTVLTQKEYGEDYVIEPMAKEMLAKDPALAREFQSRLADSTFANDPDARVNFFYTRSRWADPEQDVLPVARALRQVPEGVLAPAAGAR